MARQVTRKQRKKTKEARGRPAVPAYEKPPVREAIIDLLIEPLPLDRLDSIRGIHGSIIEKYPTIDTRHRLEAAITVQPQGLSESRTSGGVIGFIFQSHDSKQRVQMRLNGFTYNWLKPDPKGAWVGWEKVREEAKWAWERYQEVIGVQKVTRISLRYINQVVIPTKTPIELGDYFTAAIGPPKTLPYRNFDYFFSRIRIDILEIDAQAIITHAPVRETPLGEAEVIILDIDVFKQGAMLLEEMDLWKTLDQFREVKNRIFEASLRPKTKRLFL